MEAWVLLGFAKWAIERYRSIRYPFTCLLLCSWALHRLYEAMLQLWSQMLAMLYDTEAHLSVTQVVHMLWGWLAALFSPEAPNVVPHRPSTEYSVSSRHSDASSTYLSQSPRLSAAKRLRSSVSMVRHPLAPSVGPSNPSLFTIESKNLPDSDVQLKVHFDHLSAFRVLWAPLIPSQKIKHMSDATYFDPTLVSLHHSAKMRIAYHTILPVNPAQRAQPVAIVVLVGGGHLWSYIFRQVTSLLSQSGCLLFAIDMIGTGFSDRVQIDLEGHAAAVRKAISHILHQDVNTIHRKTLNIPYFLCAWQTGVLATLLALTKTEAGDAPDRFFAMDPPSLHAPYLYKQILEDLLWSTVPSHSLVRFHLLDARRTRSFPYLHVSSTTLAKDAQKSFGTMLYPSHHHFAPQLALRHALTPFGWDGLRYLPKVWPLLSKLPLIGTMCQRGTALDPALQQIDLWLHQMDAVPRWAMQVVVIGGRATEPTLLEWGEFLECSTEDIVAIDHAHDITPEERPADLAREVLERLQL